MNDVSGGMLMASINNDWKHRLGQWKKKKEQLDPVRQRRKHYCPKCGKKGFYVKMDYVGNFHQKFKICVYNFDVYECPRCKHKEKEWSRIEGKGTTGANAGRMYGSK